MKSYKVEIAELTKYVFDIQAENEEEARIKADDEFTKQAEAGMLHYYANGDEEIEQGEIWDVTDTDDDAFLPKEPESDEVCGVCYMMGGAFTKCNHNK